ncbi:hypothetical protein [Kitasatospora aureofaciens]|uniref:hypothetical protein n=1 Tax=Kitasatospora aureofaciens TaxID=1894 RepID=UPI00131E9F3D|nr:hypothetical protein [Kitasatospora aureofaciens]
MRQRLVAAVQAAIGGGASGLPDTDRLLRVVTIAKAELARNCATSSTAAELGRWLGVSASAVQQSLTRQRQAGTIVTRPRVADNGRVVGLFVGVPEQIAAHGGRDASHPLFLDRATLATFLRVLEYLFAPGWRHADGTVTQPGLLADQKGKGAPSARLAMLLLTLQAGANGRVRLCGGRVDSRGRPAATLARLLGGRWTSAGAAGVLRRLQSCDAICLIRARTRSGLRNRSRIVIRDVAAHWRPARSTCAANAAPDRPLRRRHSPASSLATGSDARRRPGDADNAAAGHLHASHAQVAGDGSEADVAGGFSGAAEMGVPAVAGGARARASDRRSRAGALPGLEAFAGEDRVLPEPELPAQGLRKRAPKLLLSETVHRVLREVPLLLARMNPWEQREVARAAGAAVWAADGDVDRVVRRLRLRYGTAENITSPYGWLTKRGLVNRSDCGQPGCESGTEVATGARCVPCGYIAEGRRERGRSGPVRQPNAPEEPPQREDRAHSAFEPAMQRRKPRWGDCRRCAVSAEVGEDGLCADCNLDDVIASAQRLVVEVSVQRGEEPQIGCTRARRVLEIASRAREDAQRAALALSGVRANVHLAVQNHLLDVYGDGMPNSGCQRSHNSAPSRI